MRKLVAKRTSIFATQIDVILLGVASKLYVNQIMKNRDNIKNCNDRKINVFNPRLW